MKIGENEGDICNRNDCLGTLAFRKVTNCSCHICPPCSNCTDVKIYCPDCEEEVEEVYVTPIKTTSIFTEWWKPVPLDNTKIDYRAKEHTHFSMIKEGVYPEGTTKKEVEEKVKGSFGGRFDYFEKGKFRYIAYTD